MNQPRIDSGLVSRVINENRRLFQANPELRGFRNNDRCCHRISKPNAELLGRRHFYILNHDGRRCGLRIGVRQSLG